MQAQLILNRRINSWRASIASSGLMRLSIFSRRSGSIAARPRTSLLRAFHFAYLLAPIPIASRAEMVQTVRSVAVTGSIRNQKHQRQQTIRISLRAGSLSAT